MRRRRVANRQLAPDAVYNNKLVMQLINMIMVRGKKALAENIVYGALNILKQKTQKEPLDIFIKALDNARPLLEVRPRRVGGATYQIPMEVKPERGYTVAIRWIRNLARSKKGRPMYEKLAAELLDAFKNEGAAIKKREDTHKMAEANKAFAHYKW